jgi:hypothetical protein
MFAIKTLTIEDLPLLMNAAQDVFDNPVDESFAREFLSDPRHHLVAAVVEDRVVGFASAVHYIHPDKPPELWIDEVGVAPSIRDEASAGRSWRRSSSWAGNLAAGTPGC